MPRAEVKTAPDFRRLLNQCEFHDWRFTLGDEPGGRLYLQLRFKASDHGGEEREWSGRKWFLSPHMTDSEVVQTALKAVLTAVEHEAREVFQFRGRAVFGPHLDIERLWSIAAEDQLERRA